MTEPTDQPLTAAQPGAIAPPVRPVWLVPHPTHQWAEDVKAIARREGLQIVDPAVASAADLEAAALLTAPQLTLREPAGELPTKPPAESPAEPAAKPAADAATGAPKVRGAQSGK